MSGMEIRPPIMPQMEEHKVPNINPQMNMMINKEFLNLVKNGNLYEIEKYISNN
jgi:hypothetical protein